MVENLIEENLIRHKLHKIENTLILMSEAHNKMNDGLIKMNHIMVKMTDLLVAKNEGIDNVINALNLMIEEKKSES